MDGDHADPNGFSYISTIAVDGAGCSNASSVLGSAAARAGEEPASGYHVRSSNKVVPGYVKGTLEKAFPGKFPFHRGGPAEPRDVPVKMEEAIAHLSRISTGAFQTTEFQLLAYDTVECGKARLRFMCSYTCRSM